MRPNTLICDKDKVFWCERFKDLCRRSAMKPHYGAVGKHGSIAVFEPAIKTLKVTLTGVATFRSFHEQGQPRPIQSESLQW